jgi:hypothetical protein
MLLDPGCNSSDLRYLYVATSFGFRLPGSSSGFTPVAPYHNSTISTFCWAYVPFSLLAGVYALNRLVCLTSQGPIS